MCERKVLLGFIRVHILHHAAGEGAGIYGVWMMRELERHGYSISPGTLYPILHEMKKSGLLSDTLKVVDGKRRRLYRATGKGRAALKRLRAFVSELAEEVA
jgi:DNA-binding PadR family transcriptional regulator